MVMSMGCLLYTQHNVHKTTSNALIVHLMKYLLIIIIIIIIKNVQINVT